MIPSSNLKELYHFRQQLHANPEISGNEKETAKTIIEFLRSCNPDEILTNVGGHGIIATWDSGVSGHEVLFRSELDALPIQEINTFEYHSNYKGVSHKCGHDGHSTILCGLAKKLAANKPASGKVRLLFQPAEENGEGAKAVLSDPNFSTIKPDYIFALHNLPGYPLNEVVIKEGIFTAAVNSIIIHLHGKTAHAAEPEHGFNPALAVAQILKDSVAMENNHPEKEDMRVITPVFVELGEKAYGISAGNAEVHLTLRCWNDVNLKNLELAIENMAKKVGSKNQLNVEFDYTQTFHANVNDPVAINYVREAAKKSGYSITERPYPFKWGEDFGLFTTQFKGCMFGLGAGENVPALHNPDYDFPDKLIESGLTVFYSIINEICNNK